MGVSCDAPEAMTAFYYQHRDPMLHDTTHIERYLVGSLEGMFEDNRVFSQLDHLVRCYKLMYRSIWEDGFFGERDRHSILPT